MWFFALVACTPDIRGLYEQERTAALTAASERPAHWEPDLRISIAEPDLEAALSATLRAALADSKPIRVALPLGLKAELRPRVNVEKAAIHPSDACPSCLGFDAAFAGRAAWSVGPASGTLPFEASADGVFSVDVEDGTRVVARPKTIGNVHVKISDYDDLRANPSKEVQDWVRAQLKEQLAPIPLIDLAASGLPLRDLRLRTGNGVTVEVLTNVPGSRPVTAARPLNVGVRVEVSETALAGLARRAAFEQGVLAMDVAADPHAMVVDGSDFTLSLRLWRLTGRGWWRDYEIEGAVKVERGKVVLAPKRAKETGQSKGAGLVDPLVALFEGKVLEAVTGALDRSLPASHSEDLGMVRLQAAASHVSGRDGTVTIDGTLDVSPPHTK